MLRKIVVLLIALNLIWWVWANNWLAWAGLPAAPAGEPGRLASQIHPEALRVQPLPPGTSIKTLSVASTAPATPLPPPAAVDVNAGKRRNRKH